MFHAYLRNKFSIVRLLNRPDKNQNYKVTDFLRKNQRLNQLFYFLITAISFTTTSIILVILRKTIIFAHSDAGSTASGVSFYRSYKIIFVGGNQMRQRPFFDFLLNFRYAKIRFILLICNILRA